MNPASLSQFKNLLIAQRNDIRDRLKSQEATRKDTQQCDVGDEGGEASIEALEPLVESEILLLEKVAFALQRIDDESYGICTGCGKDIPLSRLEAKPSVSLCLNCQKAHEDVA